MEDIQIVKEFKNEVLKAYPDAVVYFYGSRANRTHREDSDFDLLVLLAEVTPYTRTIIYDIAWETGFKYDVLIAPVLSRRDNFYPEAVSPFLNSVKNSGMVI